MEFKALGKSKSSNGEIACKTNSNRKNKKSSSNAGFQSELVMKKRGLYVEKKIRSEETTLPSKKKPPPRPRASKQKLLTSVLTILSKSTTGTQYPDVQREDENTVKKPTDPKTAKKNNKTKKTKFKSRILNEHMSKREREQLIVLQSKKDIAQTPSNYSARSKNALDSVRWTDELNERELPIRSPIIDALADNIYSGVAAEVRKEVLIDKTKGEKPLRINDDPATLASEIAKDDKKLCNIIIDLLETTINTYNLKTDYEDGENSKTVLKIGESLTKKLECNNDSLSHDYLSRKRNCKRVEKTEEDVFKTSVNIHTDDELPEHATLVPIKSKIKPKTFLRPSCSPKEISAPRLKSLENNRKDTRQSIQKALLNIFKQQLQMEDASCVEPENLYEALKDIARNKRKCFRSILFGTKACRAKDVTDSECKFRR